ncbi:polysaccharide deacetylase family protein [Saccharibacillus alkalitolerans]|uniref:ChbG/HpnK family deacetylase n=1 Tax=Saccharibacillus alkalitolerans TaxID=2705290 RepID=A0ABX0F0I6_9BACL|nr:polysaccharide deacetylase family protein [Saccharibacillus alkalitolerans]NGZ73933.1 ChbG/HpnK family deacetylase [Saccharibacillus alkalitolerans]
MLTLENWNKRRRLIVHADDFGMCHSTNRAILDLWERRAITSTTLMVNCPWAAEAAEYAARDSKFDVGVHLTSTSEWETYKWGPVLPQAGAETLTDEFGRFPADSQHMADVNPAALRAELTAQIRLARQLGVDPTHLDNHMGSLRNVHHRLLIELGAEFGLPVRFSEHPAYASGDEARIAALARELGVLHPDRVIGLPFVYGEGEDFDFARNNVSELLRNLEPGVTEMLLHPSADTEELRAITDSWPSRRFDYDLFLDPDIALLIEEENIELIGWRELRDLQRTLNA